MEKADELDTRARALDERLSSLRPASAKEVVRRMVRVLRPVLRVTYEEHGPYHQDPALEIPKLPVSMPSNRSRASRSKAISTASPVPIS